MPAREEEVIILQQFLRFPATRALTLTLLQEDFTLSPPLPSQKNANNGLPVHAVNNNNNLFGPRSPVNHCSSSSTSVIHSNSVSSPSCVNNSRSKSPFGSYNNRTSVGLPGAVMFGSGINNSNNTRVSTHSPVNMRASGKGMDTI